VGFEDRVCVCLSIVSDSNEALCIRRSCKYCVTVVRRVECAQTFRVVTSVDGIDKAQISKVINVDPVFKDDDEPI